MPFSTPTVLQARAIQQASGAGPITFAMTANLTAGSAILLVGAAVDSSTSQTLFLGTPTGGVTWSTPSSARDATPGDYTPNVVVSIAQNLSAGASPTFSVPFLKWNGSSYVAASANIRFTGVAYELGNVPTTGVLDVVRFGTSGSGATSTTPATTPTLAQDTNLLVGVSGGWYGAPGTPTTGGTWTEPTTTSPAGGGNVANGSGAGLVGFETAYRALTGTTAGQSVTMPHNNSGAGGAGQAAALIVVKGKSTTSYQYQAELPAAQFPTSVTNLEVYVWRNVAWYSALPERYVIASPTITVKPGDATRNLLKLPADPAALLADTVTIMVLRPSTGLRAGPGVGAVV
ncbi:MAG: hypothetical protein RJA99_4243 [Pseudomonadota bacterium]|jgi:hypothetical protein